MANILNRVTKEYQISVDAVEYTGGNLADWILNPDLSVTTTPDPDNWIITGNAVREMTTQEKTDRDTARAAAALSALRTNSSTSLEDRNQDWLLIQRATLKEILDYTNDLITKHNNLLTWLGTQTTLINRGQLTAMEKTNATMTQAIQAIKTRIANGEGG